MFDFVNLSLIYQLYVETSYKTPPGTATINPKAVVIKASEMPEARKSAFEEVPSKLILANTLLSFPQQF